MNPETILALLQTASCESEEESDVSIHYIEKLQKNILKHLYFCYFRNWLKNF